jgi:uncharacterized lipoprotein YmbA
MTMRTHARIACLLTLVVPVALPGCFKLARESPKLRLYVLGDGSASGLPTPPAGAPSAAREAFRIGLRRVEMASYLSVPTVMIRRGTHELIVSQFHRWGGELDQGVNRAVGAYLADAADEDVHVVAARALEDHVLAREVHFRHLIPSKSRARVFMRVCVFVCVCV